MSVNKGKEDTALIPIDFVYRQRKYGLTCCLSPVLLAELLQAIYDDLVPRPEVLDITVEDPSEEFGALRDFVDCRNAMKLSSFQPPMIHKEYADSAEKECRSKLKLQKVFVS